MMNNHVLVILLALVLVWVNTTTRSSLTHQPVAAEGAGNKKCIQQDRHSLLDFKSHLQDPYGLLSTWTAEEEEDDDCCKWNGVTCNNQTGHVIELHLAFGILEGEISPSLLYLIYLTDLNLSYNSFNGTIPRSICSLTELKSLDLSYNSFNGPIPRSIGSLTELRELNLGWNSFTGTIPESIGSLTKLKYLDLSGNHFTGTILRSIGSLTELRSLDLSYNSFNGTILRSIGSLTELRSLDLSGNSFTGTIPPEFGNLSNLEHLSLRDDFGSLAIENLDWLSHLSCLQRLNMDNISLAKANNWVNVILSLQKLSDLSLSDCDLSQVMHPYSSSSSLNSSSSSSSSSSIATLDLSHNNLNSSMYHWLFPLTSNKLVQLDLSFNMLDGIPKYLGNLCSLKTLYLDNNSVAISFSDFLNNLSGCTSLTVQELVLSSNQFTGSLADEIQQFSSLKYLDLSYNQLNGSISEKVWELPKLQTLYLSSNSLRGPISQNIGNSKSFHIDLSNNSLEGVPSKAHMSNNYHVHEIDLSSCKLLGPHFPKWIQKFKNLTRLNIANTGISDTIPMDFWDIWPSRLTYLNLSSNNITGKVPDLLSNFDPESSNIDLSFNDFYGPVPNVPSSLIRLDLSNNKFNGGIAFLCHTVNGSLCFLDLSNNSLTGQIPDCLWHFKKLKVLNLGNNYLSGLLPASIESLIELEVLYLNNNEFLGELPLSLKNCTKLTFLDFGTNRFSGIVPVWIGEYLSLLYVVSLTSNNFYGSIPLQLCQLVNLRILDLSMNKLNGTIPSCVSNLTAMVQDGFSPNQNVHHYNYEWSDRDVSSFTSMQLSEYDHVMIKWQGNVRKFSSTLGLMKSIDLSNNNLTGKIPHELADLYQLLSLNLSKNALLGEIPRRIGQMKRLQILDLSRNNLSGGIPSSMSGMSLLNYLDVSNNNLSGRIPSGTQLQSFEPSRYTGNTGLCGLPLPKYCVGIEVTPLIGEVIDELWRWFYIGGAIGFPIGFWTVCSALLLNRRGRHAFFLFLDSLKD